MMATPEKAIIDLLYLYPQYSTLDEMHELRFDEDMMATPEKAIIDLLYLYPQYSTLDEMHELRFDEDWMHDELNKERLLEYLERINSPILNKRIHLLLKAYDL